VRDRWSIEGWHWITGTQLHEDAHRYRGNGAGVMATLGTAALNLLRVAGFRLSRAGLLAVITTSRRRCWQWCGDNPSPMLAETLNQPCPGLPLEALVRSNAGPQSQAGHVEQSKGAPRMCSPPYGQPASI
jgi:hypothetical protein